MALRCEMKLKARRFSFLGLVTVTVFLCSRPPWAAAGIVFSTCPPICACLCTTYVGACLGPRGHVLTPTALPSTCRPIVVQSYGH